MSFRFIWKWVRDKLISGTNSVCNAVNLYHNAKLNFSAASTNFREWITANHTQHQFIALTDRTRCDAENVLGYTWNANLIVSLWKVNQKGNVWNSNKTKYFEIRGVSARSYGVVLAISTREKRKIFPQSPWSKYLDRNDIIRKDELTMWLFIGSVQSKLPEHQIICCINLLECDQNIRYFLLCISDASTRAYIAVLCLFHQAII